MWKSNEGATSRIATTEAELDNAAATKSVRLTRHGLLSYYLFTKIITDTAPK